jgi:hypothetical protein
VKLLIFAESISDSRRIILDSGPPDWTVIEIDSTSEESVKSEKSRVRFSVSILVRTNSCEVIFSPFSDSVLSPIIIALGAMRSNAMRVIQEIIFVVMFSPFIVKFKFILLQK